jgi:hypothetical protein
LRSRFFFLLFLTCPCFSDDEEKIICEKLLFLAFQMQTDMDTLKGSSRQSTNHKCLPALLWLLAGHFTHALRSDFRAEQIKLKCRLHRRSQVRTEIKEDLDLLKCKFGGIGNLALSAACSFIQLYPATATAAGQFELCRRRPTHLQFSSFSTAAPN